MKSFIRAISYYLPEEVLSNEALQEQFPEVNINDLTRLTGVKSRHIAAESQTAGDLAYLAGMKLFEEHAINPDEIDFVIFCTQGPDYLTPSTSCILQERLGIPNTAGTLDINQGCTGFVYGLSIANGLVATASVRNVLLLTSVNISNYIHPEDKSNRAIFGDGSAATLISAADANSKSGVEDFVFGTDGEGFDAIIIKHGGARYPLLKFAAVDYVDEIGNLRNDRNLFMNGSKVFTFSLERVPLMITQLLNKAGIAENEVDMFILQQANQITLESIFRKMKIPTEKGLIHLEECGNTVASTIPIALYHAIEDGKVSRGDTLVLAGFGVGFSWAACVVKY